MSNAIAKNDQTQGFLALVEGKKLTATLQRVLPPHVDVERFKRCILDQALTTPALLNCTHASIYTAAVRAGELGLEVGGHLGLAYLIPYKERCELVIGYKGLLELAGRSSRVRSITAGVVYQRELDEGLFSFQRAPFLIQHRAGQPGLLEGDLVYAYCVAELVTGGTVGVVLERSEVYARRPKNPRSDSPWFTREAAMWRKTAARALLGGGTVPLSPRLQAAMKHHDPEILDAEVVADEESFEQMSDEELASEVVDG